MFLELSFLLDLDCISEKSYVYVNDSSVFYRNEKGITISKNVKDCEIVSSKNFSKFYLSKSIPKKKNYITLTSANRTGIMSNRFDYNIKCDDYDWDGRK